MLKYVQLTNKKGIYRIILSNFTDKNYAIVKAPCSICPNSNLHIISNTRILFMKKKLRTTFDTRQYMLSEDFEIYYYNDRFMPTLRDHSHNYYEFYFFLGGDVSIYIEGIRYILKQGDLIFLPPGIHHHVFVHNPELPYQRIVFWISQTYYEKLLQVSTDYSYLMNHVTTNKHYIYHYDLIEFNTIQSKAFHSIWYISINFCIDYIKSGF